MHPPSADTSEPTTPKRRSPQSGSLEHVQEPTPSQVADFAALLTLEPSDGDAEALAQTLADLLASAWAASSAEAST